MWPPDPTELQALLNRALAEQGIQDQERRKAIGQLMAEMAARAWQGYTATRKGRYRWTEVNWILGVVGVISSAVGGSVLVSKDLGEPGRWIVGGLSILGGLAAGLTALLNPAEEYARTRIKSKMYEDCWRETWHYAITRLATADLEQAEAQLTLQREKLHQIDIATGLLHELDADADRVHLNLPK
jgi:hypothetical protein